jgi:hypothetical protein
MFGAKARLIFGNADAALKRRSFTEWRLLRLRLSFTFVKLNPRSARHERRDFNRA